MLQPGDIVPDFTLPVGYADHKEDVKFSSLLGHGPIVLSFFPLAFTSTCTKQMCDARDHAATFSSQNAKVFGFSCDTVFSNARFAREQQLTHGIFSDANRDVIDKIWQTYDVAGVRKVPRRGFMVVNGEGRVHAVHLQAPETPWVGNKAIEEAIAQVRL